VRGLTADVTAEREMGEGVWGREREREKGGRGWKERERKRRATQGDTWI